MQPSITRSPAPSRSVRALLGTALDYAGMFPPASLGLEEAIRNYAKHRATPDAWFLSQFVCPANRLEELATHISLFPDPGSLAVSALGLPAGSLAQFPSQLAEVLDLTGQFEAACSPNARIAAIEIQLPPDLTSPADHGGIAGVIRAAANAVETTNLEALTPFYEVTSKERTGAVRSTIKAIGDHNAGWNGRRCLPAAFKLRTGGVTAGAFPSVEQVATVISMCRDHGVRFKCTAGLHHPVRRHHESVGTEMHGFLNVFAAAVLAHSRSTDETNLRAILDDREASNFRFEDDGLAWQAERAALAEIADARRMLIVSFGSCSVEEPLTDLRELGLL